jgi:hypothetical protein
MAQVHVGNGHPLAGFGLAVTENWVRKGLVLVAGFLLQARALKLLGVSLGSS